MPPPRKQEQPEQKKTNALQTKLKVHRDHPERVPHHGDARHHENKTQYKKDDAHGASDLPDRLGAISGRFWAGSRVIASGPNLMQARHRSHRTPEPNMAYLRTLILALTLTAPAALAHDGVKDPQVAARMHAMTQIGKATKALTDMARKRTPFDAATARAHAGTIESHASDIETLFRDPADDPKSEALPAIWDSFEGLHRSRQHAPRCRRPDTRHRLARRSRHPSERDHRNLPCLPRPLPRIAANPRRTIVETQTRLAQCRRKDRSNGGVTR